MHMEECGELETEDGTFCTATYAIPRLSLTVVWVRGSLLIWNYRESKVVHWVNKPSHEHCHEELIHTSDSSSIFVLYSNSDNVKEMKQGGTCTAENAMMATLGGV